MTLTFIYTLIQEPECIFAIHPRRGARRAPTPVRVCDPRDHFYPDAPPHICIDVVVQPDIWPLNVKCQLKSGHLAHVTFDTDIERHWRTLEDIGDVEDITQQTPTDRSGGRGRPRAPCHSDARRSDP